jgi:hypothetical protein
MRIIPRLTVALVFAAVIFGAGTASAAAPQLDNAGFENGDYSSWTLMPNGGGQFVIADAGGFGNLVSQQFAGDANQWVSVTQRFKAGSNDILSGRARFIGHETCVDHIFDQGEVVILNSSNAVIATVFSFSSDCTSDSGWTAWSFVVPSNGTYSVRARVLNSSDNRFPSELRFDLPETHNNHANVAGAIAGIFRNPNATPTASAPRAGATTAAPAAGTLKPPSTGDGGLADENP